MAGDWIKMRAELFTHPKVVRISSALNADNLRTVGGLMSAWCLFDVHTEDGKLYGYTAETLDDYLRWPGFSAAMMDVGWLDECAEGLVLPDFDTHNGRSAKRRAQESERKRNVRKTSACDADKLRTREEKRREEKNINLTTSVAAVVVENRAEDETDWQRRLRKSCESLKAKIVERFPNAEPSYDVETEKLVCFYRDRPSRADPSLAVWKWFELVKPPSAWEGGKCTPEWLEKWAEEEDAKREAG